MIKHAYIRIDSCRIADTGWAKFRFTVQKIEYLHYGSYEWAEFFTADERVVIAHFLRDKTGKNRLEV
jgi:hypothetical protein